MPELPEVETTRLGIAPHLLAQTIAKVIVRNAQLRWPIPNHLNNTLPKQTIQKITRRGKYLLLYCDQGCLIMHLGMSGKLRVLKESVAAEKHDHCDIVLSNQTILRFTDPRRFGAILWTDKNPLEHSLLRNLGKEPLLTAFDAAYLYAKTRNKTIPIKQLIMDGKIVVGVGNIYANEALFLANISPLRCAQMLSQLECQQLVIAIKKILKQAIKAGGTTLKDFLQADGSKGYFTQKLLVYGREGKPCPYCQQPLQSIRLGQRSTYYCVFCQR